MIDWNATYLGNSIWTYLVFFSLVIGGVLAGKIITWISESILRAYANKTKTRLDDILLTLLEGPILLTVLIVGLHFGKNLLTMSEGFALFYSQAVAILFIVNVAWYLMRLINGLIAHYLHPLTEKSENDLDDHLLPIAKKLVNVLVWIIAGIIIIDKLGYNAGSLLAGLGIGGLAFALAAKDLIGNLFGGIAILMDKPFKMGDRIKVGDVDGHVREIGLRTTRVETFGGTMITLPNSHVVNSVTENVSAENERRVVLVIGVEYGTSNAKIEKAKKIVEQLVKKTKGINSNSYNITFNAFSASSLDLRIQYWISDKDNILGVQDLYNTALKKEFEKAKINMAFPTQTIHVKK